MSNLRNVERSEKSAWQCLCYGLASLKDTKKEFRVQDLYQRSHLGGRRGSGRGGNQIVW